MDKVLVVLIMISCSMAYVNLAKNRTNLAVRNIARAFFFACFLFLQLVF